MKTLRFFRLLCLFCVFGFVASAEETELKLDGVPLSQLLKQLRSENRGFQLRAASSLSKAEAGQIPRVIPELLPLLKSERENDRFVAAQTLGNYGAAARAAVPELLPMLQGTQFERNRAAAAKALGQILENAQPSAEVEDVAKALTAKFNEDYDRYSDVRREAVRALGMIGPAAKICIPQLTRALTDFKLHSREHFMVRQQAAWTCGRMGPLAAEHMDRLISMLHAEGANAPQIVEAIGRIGPIHDNVVPNIVDAMERFDGGIGGQIQAYKALESFGPKAASAVPLLNRFLRERRLHPPQIIGALNVLKAVGPAAKEAVPVLESYFEINRYRSKNQPDATAEQLATMRSLSRETVAVVGGANVAVEKPEKAKASAAEEPKKGPTVRIGTPAKKEHSR
jgi:HEAT repeat protein